MTDILANTFNVNPLVIDNHNHFESNNIEKIDSEDILERDFTLARETMIGAMMTGAESLSKLNDLATQSQSPRAFEVVATLAKNLSDMSRELVNLHKVKKSVDPKIESNDSAKTVNNNLFVGTTQELQRFLREMDLDKDK